MLIREAHKTLKVIASSKVEIVEEQINKILKLLKISLTFKELKQRLSSYHKDDVLAKYFYLKQNLFLCHQIK